MTLKTKAATKAAETTTDKAPEPEATEKETQKADAPEATEKETQKAVVTEKVAEKEPTSEEAPKADAPEATEKVAEKEPTSEEAPVVTDKEPDPEPEVPYGWWVKLAPHVPHPMHDPDSNVRITVNPKQIALVNDKPREGSWLDCQVKAKLVVITKGPAA